MFLFKSNHYKYFKNYIFLFEWAYILQVYRNQWLSETFPVQVKNFDNLLGQVNE